MKQTYIQYEGPLDRETIAFIQLYRSETWAWPSQRAVDFFRSYRPSLFLRIVDLFWPLQRVRNWPGYAAALAIAARPLERKTRP